MHCDLGHLRTLLQADNAGSLLAGFDERRRGLEARLGKARRRPSEKAVHNLRVAGRRMLATLALLEGAVPSKHTRKTRKTLGKRLRKLRLLRDVQVQIGHTEQLLADYPQLAPFQQFLTGRERRLTRRVGQQLRAFRPRWVGTHTERILDRLVASLDAAADADLGSKMGASLGDAYHRVLSLRIRIDPGRPSTIHRMRLAFKKFRYMAEVAAPCFPQLSPERLKAMSAYQDRMGAVQDMESLLRTMMGFRRRSGRTSILVVENEIRRRRQRLIDDFFQTADEIRFFWSVPQAESREVG